MEALHPDVSEVILSEEDIKSIVSRMGAEITRDYKDKNPLLVTVLKGADHLPVLGGGQHEHRDGDEHGRR